MPSSLTLTLSIYVVPAAPNRNLSSLPFKSAAVSNSYLYSVLSVVRAVSKVCPAMVDCMVLALSA